MSHQPHCEPVRGANSSLGARALSGLEGGRCGFRLVGDLLRPPQLALQRLVGVLEHVHVAGGQVMQLDPNAAPSQRRGRRDRVQRERHRAAGVVDRQRTPAGLVVDDDQFAIAVVEPVDPTGEREPRGAGSDRPLDTQRLMTGIERGNIPLHQRAPAREPTA